MNLRSHIASTWLGNQGASAVAAVLLTTVMATARGRDDPAFWSQLFVGNLALSASITLSLSLGLACALHTPFGERLAPGPRALVFSVTFLVMALVGIETGLWLIHHHLPVSAGFFPRSAVLRVALPVSLAMVAIGALRDQRAQAQRARESALEQLAEARLSALAARTHPHFLFNALNGIAALIEEDARAGEQAVLELARLFRYVLEGSDAATVPLANELAFVRGYLAMEGLRFGARLVAQVEAPDSLLACAVPPLVLQPLVENAVRHGLAERERLAVTVRVEPVGDELHLTVDDDGPGPGHSGHHGSGTSQRDLRARLSLAYGKRARLETGPSPLGGFRALVCLPREAP